MAFSKSFPKHVEGSNYPIWVEITLSDEEEKKVEQDLKAANLALFEECIVDAQSIIKRKALNASSQDLISIASTLFEKRASHVVYLKERLCKNKFDS